MLHLYDTWLRSNNLIVKSSHHSKGGTNSTAQSPTFCIITWGDSDIGTILKEQCKRLDIELPAYFHEWINLKALFKQHFGWEPRGGLQNVVERCGCTFEGRAHSGLVDSRNTAKIVQKMLQEGFRFTRATRNIHAYKPR
jgi:inhibitor of KinA sporulation pathway (predicted exonuclease)